MASHQQHGHLILTDAIWPLQQSDAFKEMFNVVIQLGAILAVVVLYWSKLWPFHRKRIPQRSWFAQQSTNGFVGSLQRFGDPVIAVWTRSSCG